MFVQAGKHHQTNDVIAQSGKCHVMSLVAAGGKKAREHAPILWPAHELQTDTGWHR